MVIVGDAFARPLADVLDAEPTRWDVSRLRMIISGGAMWTDSVKQRLLRHNPDMTLVDMFGSSEALGIGRSVSRAGDVARTARFRIGRRSRVLRADGRDVVPGSGEIGMVAVTGFQPVGYYKDPQGTAAAFRVVDGKRYSIPGDYARVESDGSLTLLGRGSNCINRGGEKIFPEEVERVLASYAGVRDAAVLGVADEHLGESVIAFLAAEPGQPVPDPRLVLAHTRGRLASFKVPSQIFVIETIPRAANGKIDYKRLREYVPHQPPKEKA